MSSIVPRSSAESTGNLRREVGLVGAVFLGLGSILGTGVFVSIGVAAGIAGPAVILATALAALIACANGLSSAQLAASHPVSGGTYEYGYRYLSPTLGFTAGWMFLAAKSASAATAALGLSGYLLEALGASDERWLVPIALTATALLTILVLGGLRRSNLVNTIVVSVTLLALGLFVASAGTVAVREDRFHHWTPFFAGEAPGESIASLLHATALLFVAYTGYGRVATLGEEVREPRRTIPRAIVATLVASFVIYAAVSAAGVGAVGAGFLAEATGARGAVLETAARSLGASWTTRVVAVGAITAMAGVLLNLLLGVSRVALAMGRRGDLPRAFGRVSVDGRTPRFAVLGVGALVAALVLVGDVRTTWSFSAFTVLVYYALTNLAALRLAPGDRFCPRWIAVAGLASCVFVAFWVEPRVWLAGLGLLALGLLLRAIFRRTQS